MALHFFSFTYRIDAHNIMHLITALCAVFEDL